MNAQKFVHGTHGDLSRWIVLSALMTLGPAIAWEIANERWRGAVIYVALGSVPLFLRWPVVSTLGLYALVVPFDSVAAIDATGGGTFVKLFGMVALCTITAVALVRRRLILPPRAALWWGTFLGWGILSAAWAVEPESVFNQILTKLSLFALYVAGVSIRLTRKELHCLCVLLVLGGTMAAAVTYWYGEGYAQGRSALVLGGQVSNPNALGLALTLPFALALAGCVMMRNTVYRVVAAGMVLIVTLGLYACGSRGALVGALVALTVFIFRIGVKKEIVAALVALVVLTAVLPSTFFARVEQIYTGEDTTGSGRTDIWQEGLVHVTRYGVFGAGLDSFGVVYERRIPGVPRAAHNSYLAIWVELGIVGLGLMLSAIGSQLRAVRKAHKAGRGGVLLFAIEAGCFGMLALMFFGDEIWRKALWLGWMLLTWAAHDKEGASDTELAVRSEPRLRHATAAPAVRQSHS